MHSEPRAGSGCSQPLSGEKGETIKKGQPQSRGRPSWFLPEVTRSLYYGCGAPGVVPENIPRSGEEAKPSFLAASWAVLSASSIARSATR